MVVIRTLGSPDALGVEGRNGKTTGIANSGCDRGGGRPQRNLVNRVSNRRRGRTLERRRTAALYCGESNEGGFQVLQVRWIHAKAAMSSEHRVG